MNPDRAAEPDEVRAACLHWLMQADPVAKAAGVRALGEAAAQRRVDTTAALAEPEGLPGRPGRPRLVPPEQVPRRAPGSVQGRAALLHAIAHIEFNAINLALDACWRFAGLPEPFYRQWLQVAAEEALHFTLLREHLLTLGHDYGDFDAHDGLWAMCLATRGDVVARMALVPRTLEARGLDATPLIQRKLAAAGDPRAVEILDVILRDEIGHVAVGNRWYGWACAREGLDPVAHYADLQRRYKAPRLKPPFNEAARAAAGFSADEIAALKSRGG